MLLEELLSQYTNSPNAPDSNINRFLLTLETAIEEANWIKAEENIKFVKSSIKRLHFQQILQYTRLIAKFALEAPLTSYEHKPEVYKEFTLLLTDIFNKLEEIALHKLKDNPQNQCQFFYYASLGCMRYAIKNAFRYANEGQKIANAHNLIIEIENFNKIAYDMVEFSYLKAQATLLLNSIEGFSAQERKKLNPELIATLNQYSHNFQQLKLFSPLTNYFSNLTVFNLMEKKKILHLVEESINTFQSKEAAIFCKMHKLCENFRLVLCSNKILAEEEKKAFTEFLNLAYQCIKFTESLIQNKDYKNAKITVNELLLHFLGKLQDSDAPAIEALRHYVHNLLHLIEALSYYEKPPAENKSSEVVEIKSSNILDFLNLIEIAIENNNLTFCAFALSTFFTHVVIPHSYAIFKIFPNAKQDLKQIIELFQLTTQALSLNCKIELTKYIDILINYFREEGKNFPPEKIAGVVSELKKIIQSANKNNLQPNSFKLSTNFLNSSQNEIKPISSNEELIIQNKDSNHNDKEQNSLPIAAYWKELFNLQQDYQSAQHISTFSHGVRKLIKNIADEIILKLGNAPKGCNFALIGTGSISRNMLSPHSDIDIAFLIEKKENKRHLYFRYFIELFELHMLWLGDYTPALICTGFGLDTSDIKYLMINENAPLEQKAGAFINAPDEMLKEWMKEDNINVCLAETYSLFRPVLLAANSVVGENLLSNYYKLLGQKLELNQQDALNFKPSNKCIEYAKKYITQHINPIKSALLKKSQLTEIHLKDHFLQPIFFACADLCLYHGISSWHLDPALNSLESPKGSTKNINNNNQKNESWENFNMVLSLENIFVALERILSSDFVNHLKQALFDILAIRLKLHHHFKRSDDVIEIEKYLELKIITKEDIQRLEEITNLVLRPLYYCLEKWQGEKIPVTPINVISEFFEHHINQNKLKSMGFTSEEIAETRMHIHAFIESCKAQDISVSKYLAIYEDLPADFTLIFYEKIKEIETLARFEKWIELIADKTYKKYPPSQGPLPKDVTESVDIILNDLVHIMAVNQSSIEKYEEVYIKLNDSLWQFYRNHIQQYESSKRSAAIIEKLDTVPYTNGYRNSVKRLEKIFVQETKHAFCDKKELVTQETQLKDEIKNSSDSNQSLPPHIEIQWTKRDDGKGTKYTGWLHPKIVKYLIDQKYIDVNSQKWNAEAKKNNQTRGRHLVIPITVTINGCTINWHLKIYPELPGIEIAATTLTHMLVGPYAPFVELIRLKLGKEWYPVLISQTLTGICLQDYFDPTKNLNINIEDQLDPFMLSQMFLASLMLANEDGKPDNYIIRQAANGKFYIVCIDNDRSFYPVVLKEGSRIIPVLKNILFFFKQWQARLDLVAIQHWLRLDAESLLSHWLDALDLHNRRFTKLFTADELEKLSVETTMTSFLTKLNWGQIRLPSIVPIPLQAGTISQLYVRLQETQRYLRGALNNNQLMHLNELVNRIEPWLGGFYDYYFALDADALTRFHKAFGIYYGTGDKTEPHISLPIYHTLKTRYGKPVDVGQLAKTPTLSLDLAKRELRQILKQPQDMEELSTQFTMAPKQYIKTLLDLPENKRLQFVNKLDFRKIDSATQEYILSILLQTKDSPQDLKLAYCAALNDDKLAQFLKNSFSLTHLNIAACDKVRFNPKIISISQLPALCADLVTLNLSNLPALEMISRDVLIGSNKIVFLRLRKLLLDNCRNLKQVHIEAQELQELSVHGCKALTQLNVTSKNLIKLDVTATYLDNLDKLLNLIDLFPTLNHVTNATVRKLGQEIRQKIVTSILLRDTSIVQKLIILGININQRDAEGNTALFYVINANDLELGTFFSFLFDRSDFVKILLENGADPNQGRQKDNFTPLMAACMSGNLEIANILLAQPGIRVNQATLQGFTALHIAAINNHSDIVKALINKQAQIDCQDKTGRTSLLLACSQGALESVKILVEAGASIDFEDENGDTSLIVACEENHLSVVQYLLEKGANINHMGHAPLTNPLMSSIHKKHLEITKFLLGNEKLNIHLTDCNGVNALSQAIMIEQYEICDYLIEHGARLINPCKEVESILLVQSIAKNKNEKTLRYMQKAGFDMNQPLPSVEHITPLIVACHIQDLEMVKLFVELGAKVNQPGNDEKKLIPLVVAATLASIPIVEFLVNAGADINGANEADGVTSLIAAAAAGNSNIIEIILKLGADINKIDAHGNTALHIAVANNHLQVVSLLLENGANIFIADEDNNTPLITATIRKNLSAIKLLLAHAAKLTPVENDRAEFDDPLLQVASTKDENNNSPEVISINHSEQSTAVTKENIANSNSESSKLIHIIPKTISDYLEHKSKVGHTVLFIVAINGQENILDELLLYKPELNYLDSNGFTPLMVACQEGYEAIVRKLVAHGADITKIDDNHLRNALMMAVVNKHSAIVDFLISLGADINFVSSHEKLTPLFAGVRSGNLAITQKLLNSGADLNVLDADDENLLIAACQSGNIEMVKFFIPHLPINHLSYNGMTALMYACIEGNVDIVSLLLNASADPGIIMPGINASALMLAVMGKHTAIVKLLLNQCRAQLSAEVKSKALAIADFEENQEIKDLLLAAGAKKLSSSSVEIFLVTAAMMSEIMHSRKKIESLIQDIHKSPHQIITIGSFKLLPLTFAILINNLPLIEFLLDAPVEIDRTDEQGNTALILTCQLGYTEIANLLINRNADVNLTNDSGNLTPLIAATIAGNVEIIRKLQSAGAQIDYCTTSNKTALIAAAIEGHDEVVKQLIEYGANIKYLRNSGFTPLMGASANGRLFTVKILIEAGADINQSAADGMTPLILACLYNHPEVVNYLLEQGAYINHLEHGHQCSALLAAAQEGHVEVANLLIKKGADLDLITDNGVTALHCAIRNGHIELALLLINNGANYKITSSKDGLTPYLIACHKGNLAVIKTLIEKGDDTEQLGQLHQESALMLACQGGHPDVIDYLLANNQSDVNYADKSKRTALMLSCQSKNIEIVKKLLRAGARVNAVDSDGDSALIYAILSNQLPAFILLIEQGAEIKLANHKGQTPLLIASHKNREEMVNILLAKNALVNQVDHEGHSPLIVATYQGSLTLIKTLINHGANVDQRTNDGGTAFTLACELKRHEVVIYLLQYMLETGKIPEHVMFTLSGEDDESKILQMAKILCVKQKQLQVLSTALEHYELLVALEPTCAHALHNLGAYYHVQAEDEKAVNNHKAAENKAMQAEICFQRALEVLPHCSTLTEYANFLVNNRRYEEAIPYLKRALTASDNSGLVYGVMEINTVDERLKDEINRHGQIQVYPQVFAYELLIKSYCQLKQSVEAELLIPALQKIVEEKDDFVSYLLLSLAYADLGNSMQAERFAKIAKNKSLQALKVEKLKTQLEDLLEDFDELNPLQQLQRILIGLRAFTVLEEKPSNNLVDDDPELENRVEILEELQHEPDNNAPHSYDPNNNNSFSPVSLATLAAHTRFHRSASGTSLGSEDEEEKSLTRLSELN